MNKGTIVTLGDCASNGNNALAHKVCNDNSTVMTYSLQYFNEYKKISKWFMHRYKNGYLQCDTPLSVDNIKEVALKTMRDEEKKISWPKLLDWNETVNLSINGNHFGYYLIQLKRYIEQNKKPNHVLVTDFTVDHMFLSFWHNNQKYNLLTNFTHADQEYQQGKQKYPPELHEFVVKKIRKEHKLGKKYALKKHKRYFNLLINYLNKQQINFSCVLIRDNFQELFSPYNTVDLREDSKKTLVDPSNEFSGEICIKKFEIQKTLAKKVDSFIASYYHNKDIN